MRWRRCTQRRSHTKDCSKANYQPRANGSVFDTRVERYRNGETHSGSQGEAQPCMSPQHSAERAHLKYHQTPSIIIRAITPPRYPAPYAAAIPPAADEFFTRGKLPNKATWAYAATTTDPHLRDGCPAAEDECTWCIGPRCGTGKACQRDAAKRKCLRRSAYAVQPGQRFAARSRQLAGLGAQVRQTQRRRSAAARALQGVDTHWVVAKIGVAETPPSQTCLLPVMRVHPETRLRRSRQAGVG